MDAQAEQDTNVITGQFEDPDEDLSPLVDALARAQARFGVIPKTKTAEIRSDKGNYQYAYADLADLIAAVKGPLGDEGIWWGQDAVILTINEGGTLRAFASVTTWFRKGNAALSFGPLDLPVLQSTPQGAGSAITYARRYALSAALGVASEADDDGALAGAGSTKDRSPKITQAQMASLHALASQKGKSHQDLHDWVGSHLGIESTKELTRDGAKALRSALDALPDVAPAEPTEADELKALWTEAREKIGTQAEVIGWYRDEFKIEGSTKKADITVEHLRRLIAIADEIHGGDAREGSAGPSGEDGASG